MKIDQKTDSSLIFEQAYEACDLQGLKGFAVTEIEDENLGEYDCISIGLHGPKGKIAYLLMSDTGEYFFLIKGREEEAKVIEKTSNSPSWGKILAYVKAKKDIFQMGGVSEKAAITQALRHEEQESGVDLTDFK